MIFTDNFSYANERILGWLDPFNEQIWQETWQTRNSLYAIGSGGLLGLGLGNSRQKYLYLPEPQNDFIFAIVCEELGLIGALIIIILFALLVWRGISISLKAKDKFGSLLGIGLSAQVGLQVILNIAVVTNTIPNTGISCRSSAMGHVPGDIAGPDGHCAVDLANVNDRKGVAAPRFC